MRLKRWPLDMAATAGAAAGALLALWSAPDLSPTMTDLWCAGVVGACVAAVVGATTIRNRYLR